MHHRDRKCAPCATPQLKVLAFHLAIAFVAANAMAPGSGWAQGITPDGRTATTVGTVGNVTDVHTTTRSGANAFNSFHTFNVKNGQVANLHLPVSAANLINLVRDQRTTIDGMLNAICDGKIGGNVYFANPHGFLVSTSGVVNVGSLHVSTPTQNFVNDFFTASGAPDEAAVARLLGGTAPRSDGNITIDGRVNAIDGASLSAGAINVGGAIYSGARFVGVEPDFTDVVNANGLSTGTRMVVREGRIQIVADTDVAISGTISADGSAGINGGDVTIRAGGNLNLDDGALVSASGSGVNSSGGTVDMWADDTAVTHKGALVDASAGDSGDGGFIEFSARDTVELAGGEFRADGRDGAAGQILIDPLNIIVSDHILRGASGYASVPAGGAVAGANLTLLADEKITVNDNIVISSRQVAGADANAHRNESSTGDSGNLTFEAPNIELGNNSAVLANADNGHVGGNILFDAKRSGGELSVFSSTTTGITMTNAIIRGHDITLSASSAHASTISPIVVKTVEAVIDINASTLDASNILTLDANASVNAETPNISPLGTIDVTSIAAVNVHGASQLSSGSSTSLTAGSTVTAKALPGLPDFVSMPGDAGVAIVIVDSSATVDIGGTSTVDAGGALALGASNTVDVEAITDASATGSTAVGGAVAVAVVDTTTRAAIKDSARVTNAASVTLGANSANTIVASATAAAGGASEQGADESKTEETLSDYQNEASTSDGGVTFAAAVAVSDLTSTTESLLQSDDALNASGQVTVSARALNQSEVIADGSSAGGDVGVGIGVAINLAEVNNHAKVAQTVTANGLTVEARLPNGGEINRFTTSATSGAAASNVGVAGSLALNTIDNTSTALIAPVAVVSAGTGNVVIDAENRSESTAKALPAEDAAAAGEKVGIGASVAVNVVANESRAELADAATLTGGNTLTVTALGEYTAETEAEAGSVGGVSVTPVAAVTVVDNQTVARLGTGNPLDLSGGVTVEATHSSTISTSAKGSSQGEKAAVGIAVAVTIANDSAVATTARDIKAGGAVRFAALTAQSTETTATASAKGGKEETKDGGADDTPDDGVDQAVGKQASFGQDKQKAGSTNKSQQPASAESSEGKISVAAAVSVNVADASAQAYVPDGVKVDTTGSLTVEASGNTDAGAHSDGSAAGSTATVGIGAAVSVNSATTHTDAWIGNADIFANGVTVRAFMTDIGGDTANSFTTSAKAGAGGGKVGIAGALALNLIESRTIAEIRDDASVDVGGGDLDVSADSESVTSATALPDEPASGGKVGVGASVALNLFREELVRARIGKDVEILDTNNIRVVANADSDTKAEAQAGAAGSVAVDAVVALSELKLVTEAVIESGDDIDADGAVEISATSTGTHDATATGDVKSDKVGVGASAAIIISNTTTRAALDRDLATGNDADDNLTVDASATRTYEAVAKASAAGGKGDDDLSQSEKDNAKSTSTLKDNEDSQQGVDKSGSSGKVNVAAAAGVLVIDDDVSASITAGTDAEKRTIETGGALSVTAFNSSDFSARGLGDALDITAPTGGAAVGIGVGVGLAILRNDTTASIGNDTHIVQAGDITVGAESKQNTSPDFAFKLAAEGVAGAGSDKVSVAGALAVANSNATTKASIGDNVLIDQAGAISIQTDNTSKLAAKAWSVATSGKVGVGASIAVLVSNNEYQAWLGEGANVTATSLTVAARNHKITGPVDFDWSLDGLEDRFTDANLQILLGQNNYYTETIAGAASGKVSVAGAFSVNVFDDTTEAWIGNGSDVTTTGAVELTAQNETTAKAFAGGVSAAGKVGVGLASSNIANTSTTRAFLDDHARIKQAGSVMLDASGYMDLAVISASAAGAGTAGVGGVLSLILSENVVEAFAGNGAYIQSDDALAISATNIFEALNVAGVASVGGTAGVGVSSGVNLIDNETSASIGAAAEISVAGLTSVDATSSADVLSVVVGGAGGGTAGVAASGAVNIYNPITQAWIAGNTTINFGDTLTTQGVRVSADATTDLLSIVGTVGIGGTAGVGGAADVIVIDKTTQAWVAGGSTVRTGIGDLAILADASEKIRSVGVGLSAGGTAGVQGSASVLVLTTDTQAYADDLATLYSTGNLIVAASGKSELDLLAGAIGAAGTAAVGAGAAVSVVDKTTHAWIGDNANVTALGNSDAVDVATGEFGVSYIAPTAADGEVAPPEVTPSNGEDVLAGGSEALNKTRTTTGTTRSLRGLAVTAVNQDAIQGFAVTGAASGTASVTISGEVSVHSTDTKAWIGNNATVNDVNTGANAQQSVLVAAGNDSYHLGIAGALSASGTVGVGVGADVAVMKNDTHAWVGDLSTTNARKDVSVLANSNQDVVSISASLGASGTVGVSGSVSVLSFDNETWAWIGDGANVDAGGNVAVNASDDTATTLIAGTVALGLAGGGVGGGVGVTLIDKDTRTWIGDNASVDARGQDTDNLTAFSGDSFGGTTTMRGLQVMALSSEDLFTITAAGAGGLYVGIAGAVSVSTVDSDTLAYIGNGAQINTGAGVADANQDVNVTAHNDLSLFNVSGALGVGAVGIAGAVDVGVIRNDTTAFIGNDATVNAARDVDVNALASKDIETYVVSASGGLAAIAAGVAVYSVGGALDSDSQDRLKGDDGDTTGAYADTQATDSSLTDGFLADYDDQNIVSASDKVRTARNGTTASGRFTATETRTLPAGNAAFIGADTTINAGRHVDLDVRENVDFDMLTGALSIGAVGLGAGVGVANFHNDNTAFIDDNATINAGAAGTITLNAKLTENISALAIAGTGGVVAIDAAVAMLGSTGSVSAALGDDITIDRTALVRVEADDDRTLEAETTGVSVGAVAAGASVTTATIGGTTSATVGNDARIGQNVAHNVGGVEVEADAAHTAIAKARAAKGGLGLAASGTVSTATVDPSVIASVGPGSQIKAQGDVLVSANAASSARADSIGINVSAGASLGASVALATASPTIVASLGSDTVVDAGSLSILATQSLPTSGRSAYAAATGASGGLLLGANATFSRARNTGEVQALVGHDSTLDIAGVATVSAANVNSQLSDVAGLSGGLIAIGANFAHAESETLTEAVLGDQVKVTAQTLQVLADGDITNHAHGISGSGGLASVPFSEASTSTTTHSYARTGSGDNTHGNARKIDVASLLIDAQQTSTFDSWMRSTNASLVGVSGAQASNTAKATTEAHVGTNGYIEADNITLQASNTVFKQHPASVKIPGSSIDVPSWNVNSSSGGLADVPAAGSTTDIVTNALTQVGAGAHLVQTGLRSSPGTYVLDAWNQVTATDKVKMASGGAISAASGASLIRADINNATVRVGDFATLNGVGDIKLGARSIADLSAQTSVDVYGAVGVAPFGESLARFVGNNRIEIGAASIEALNDIRLSAGANAAGVNNDLSATARSDVFNNTAIPVNRDPVADAIITTQSYINVAHGAELGAVRHVMLYAEKGTATASGVGIGKDLYREALAAVASAISNAFGGGDVSFETRTGRSIKNQGANVAVNGDVRVGIHRKQALEIGFDGMVTKRTDGISITDTGFRAIAADILDRIADLKDLIRQYTVDRTDADASIAVAAYESEIRFLERKLDELGLRLNADGTGGFSDVAGISPKQAAEGAVIGMSATRDGYTTTRDALDDENTALSSQNGSLSSQNTTLTATNATLIAMRDGLHPEDDATQIAALNTQINNNNATISANNTTISTNNTTINTNTTQITQLDGQINSLSGQIVNIQHDLAANVYSSDVIGGPIATFLTVSDTIARLGNIYVRGDSLNGAGTLDAPGDAEIHITNNGPSFLVLKNLTIPPDEGGKLYFNSIDVLDNDQINGINSTSSGAAFSIHTAESQVDANGNPLSQPQILIESKYDPLNPFYIAQTPAGTPTLAPDIILQGDISNLRGLVKIDSAAGSIRLEQKRDGDGNIILPVETANVRAGEVEIKTRNGDFVQSYTDAFFHTAGAPLVINPGDPELNFPGNVDKIDRSPEVAGKGIIANGSVLIAARYLNINGTIQSGIPEWGVRIPASATVTIPGGVAGVSFADAQTHYNALSPAERAALGAEFYTVSGARVDGLPGNVQGSWEQVTVLYNAKENRLELGGVQVQGGYIELFGQIFNTNQSGGGQLRVMDGYGQISINNQTALPVWVNLLDTGRGVDGEINITNIVGVNADGTTLIATETHRREGGSRNGGYYNPTDGLRYVLTVGYDTVREDFYRYSRNGWFNITGASALDQYKINSITRDSDPLSQGEFLDTWPSPAVANHYFGRSQTQTTNSVRTRGRSWKDCNWWTLCANARHYHEFTITTGSKTTITDSVRGDYGIGIEYIGFDTGSVNIASSGNVVFNGSINNRNGDTTVTSTGSIAQNGDLAIIGGNNVSLSAGTGIGAETQSVQINVKNGGKLNAISGSGDIRIRQMVGDLAVGTVGGAGVSNVMLETARNLYGWDANSLVQARRVELMAENGGIGDLGGSTPFRVSTGYTTNQAQWPNNGLIASARGDIYLRNVTDPGNASIYSGDLLLIAVKSLAGDVRIEAAGNAIDNNPFETTDTRTEAELADLWDSLRLRGAGAVEKANEAVAAFENGKTNNYTLYWQFRERQGDGGLVYDPAFEYAVSSAERQALTDAGLDATQIDTFAENRSSQYHQLHAEVGAFSDSYNAGFRYAATAEEEAAIRKGSSWSDAQLILSVGAGLLKNITDTVTTIKEPNVVGRNITLIAAGDIGSFNDPQEIDLSKGLDELTTAQKAALAAAERGDATVNGDIITILQPRPLNVTTGTGALNAGATGLVFMGSEHDLRIDRITAIGDVRIKTAGSLVNAASIAGFANVTGNSIILEAAQGGIGGIPGLNGVVSTQLLVNTTSGAGLIARAAGDIWLQSSTDMMVDTMFSLSNIRLDADGSILDFHLGESTITPENNLRARDIFLSSTNGAIGSTSNSLDAGVNANGAIYAYAPTFGQGIYLNGPAGEYFNIGEVISGDAIALSSASFMFVNGLVTGPGPISMVSGSRMTLTPSADVHATTLGVFLRAGELLMQDAGNGIEAARMQVDVGTIDIGTAGDAIITGIFTGNPTESAIVIHSGGSIFDGGDGRMDITAKTGPAARLTMTAGGQIGGNPLDLDVLFLDATAATGLIHINVPNAVEIGTLQAPGEVELTAGGDITGNTIVSTGSNVDVLSSGGSIGLASVLGDTVRLRSATGDVNVGQISVDSGVVLEGDDIAATIVGTGTSPIVGAMTGFGGGVASNINVTLSSPAGFQFSRISAAFGSIDVLLGSLGVSSFFVDNRMVITNPQTRLLIDQDNLALQGFDVQLYPDGNPFSLSLTRNLVATSAYLIDRRPTHEVIIENGPNLSVVEYTLQVLAEMHGAPDDEREGEDYDADAVVAFVGFPVATDDDDSDRCRDDSTDTTCETE